MSNLAKLFPEHLPRVVMFDLDGTLVDSVPDLAVAVDKMLVELGREPVGIEAVRIWIGNGAKVLVRRALASDMEHAHIDDAEAARALELFMGHYGDSHALTTLYPGVVETLKWLHKKRVKMALITNKPEQFVAPLLDELGLGRFFKWIIGGDTLPQQKPDPAALLFVMKMANARPRHALFVGDSRSDVLAAKAAGVACVAMSYGYNHGRPISEESPTLVIDDLRALIPGCLPPSGALTLAAIDSSPQRDSIVVVTRKLWMKVIKALARWRWRA
jgi:phosphoglycolate phosphatase